MGFILLFGEGTAKAGVHVEDNVHAFYEIHGVKVNQLKRAVRNHGVRNTLARFGTKYHREAQFGREGNECFVKEVSFHVTNDYYLPKWVDEQLSDDHVRELWKVFYEAILESQKVLAGYMFEAVKEMEYEFLHLARMPCDEIEEQITNLENSIYQKYKAHRDAYHQNNRSFCFPHKPSVRSARFDRSEPLIFFEIESPPAWLNNLLDSIFM
jgi:predicted secreted Zn-dependent protease